LSQFDRLISVIINTQSSRFTIKNLHISFTVQKTESSDSNKCSISIYNLSDSTINTIKESGLTAILNAGYKQGKGEEVLFIGDICNVSTQYEFPNKITMIDLYDGQKALTYSKTSVSYREGADSLQILRDALNKFGLPIKTDLTKLVLKNKQFLNAFSFAGSTKTLVDTLTKHLGLDWSIQNGELKLYTKEKLESYILINLSSETGLLNVPESIKIQSKEKTGERKEEIDGFRIKALLQPKAEPAGTISLTSRNIPKGSKFRIYSVNHIGSNYEGDFQTVMEVVKYE